MKRRLTSCPAHPAALRLTTPLPRLVSHYDVHQTCHLTFIQLFRQPSAIIQPNAVTVQHSASTSGLSTEEVNNSPLLLMGSPRAYKHDHITNSEEFQATQVVENAPRFKVQREIGQPAAATAFEEPTPIPANLPGSPAPLFPPKARQGRRPADDYDQTQANIVTDTQLDIEPTLPVAAPAYLQKREIGVAEQHTSGGQSASSNELEPTLAFDMDATLPTENEDHEVAIPQQGTEPTAPIESLGSLSSQAGLSIHL